VRGTEFRLPCLCDAAEPREAPSGTGCGISAGLEGPVRAYPTAGRQHDGGRARGIQGAPCPLQRAVYRGDRRVQQVRRFGRRVAEDLAQDQRGPLTKGGGVAGPLQMQAPRTRAARSGRPGQGACPESQSARSPPRLSHRVAASRGPSSIGTTRGRRRRITSSEALVAIRQSQLRSEPRPSKLGSPFQARTSVSCNASSAPSGERSNRRH
jgi:hypothetical protein